MFIFQIITFFLQLGFLLLCSGMFIFFPIEIITHKYKEKVNFKTHINYGGVRYNITGRSERYLKIEKIIIKAIGVAIAILITMYMTVPYLLDVPKLITGNFNYVTGQVTKVSTKKKDFNEYVYIGGKEVRFFFSANVEKNSRYKIGYLPNTSRAIYGEKLDNYTSKVEDKIGFPIKKILFFIGFFVALGIIAFVAHYIVFKLLILSSAIFYPFNIYLYIKSGLAYGDWFSKNNEPLGNIILFGVVLMIFWGLYFVEKRKDQDNEAPLTLVFIQVIAILQIVLVLSEGLHLF
ncbi:hypothetical protein Clocel_3004 [Clostridium cellulovorans 743B]|uniref:Uncharacterized protein n=2 Tax=Clostridium cellulovorans TaxID=1493 RepID=D9STG1_CLOC7|nr:hypothetical protein Clocel_3004 [Clostridium cellulovorans 743B]